MEFEFDPAKSAMNKEKHGIDFIEAQELWRGTALLTSARSDDEPRLGLVGIVGGKCWMAVFTLRDRSVRIISVRRARDYERKLYEDHISGRIRQEVR
ncbi:BrnT family toxin [Rhizobium sp. CG5]|uniref:BrnT family toxin n=1 Tax=Rhizobium sp. CG5 TaxID=2726076 RepID=UPI0020346109|nr:BrnT family toxin [Rhizobium sp. CG5]MCM2477707.1 BrnT family toxin [Rhizobium sp. CG5]